MCYLDSTTKNSCLIKLQHDITSLRTIPLPYLTIKQNKKKFLFVFIELKWCCSTTYNLKLYSGAQCEATRQFEGCRFEQTRLNIDHIDNELLEYCNFPPWTSGQHFTTLFMSASEYSIGVHVHSKTLILESEIYNYNDSNKHKNKLMVKQVKVKVQTFEIHIYKHASKSLSECLLILS